MPALRASRTLVSALLLLATACPSDDDPKVDTGSSTGTPTTTAGTSSSSDSGNSEGGFIDSSSSGASSGSTGPACSEREMCQSLGDCELGECIDCTCVFDYGPCEPGMCTCFVPSVEVCVEGGCFCSLPCVLDEPQPCPVALSGTATPVCAVDEISGSCGLPCAGEGAAGCPDGMMCVARPDEQPAWGDFVCVFAS
ncbi:MAG: hypothetical protein IAG13_22820 [Deltaproteobacteria bacterium]|nr:hypothetical protein [Nannocystaceae bacterium]